MPKEQDQAGKCRNQTTDQIYNGRHDHLGYDELPYFHRKGKCQITFFFQKTVPESADHQDQCHDHHADDHCHKKDCKDSKQDRTYIFRKYIHKRSVCYRKQMNGCAQHYCDDRCHDPDRNKHTDQRFDIIFHQLT